MLKNSYDLFVNDCRFDLIFKYLYSRYDNFFTKLLYLENIRIFNDFKEYESYPPTKPPYKDGCLDFATQFDSILHAVKYDQFDAENNKILISKNNFIINGAHRLTAHMLFNKNIDCQIIDKNYIQQWTWQFFKESGFKQEFLDFGALEFVKLNPHAYIVNLFPLADQALDNKVYDILNKYGQIYYVREHNNVTFNQLINIKKKCYSENGKYEAWLGSPQNCFDGAQKHAKISLGNGGNLRIVVFICNDINLVRNAKIEIRRLYGLGNHTCHINDTHDGAIKLAQIYFNENTFNMLKYIDFIHEDYELISRINLFKQNIAQFSILDVEDFILVGSVPLNVLGKRKSRDIDYLALKQNLPHVLSRSFSPHDSQLKYYTTTKEQLIWNPKNYFYFNGIKVLSLKNLYRMKKTRNEIGKDDIDCRLIENLIN